MFVDLGVCAGLCAFNVTLARAQDAPSSCSCLFSQSPLFVRLAVEEKSRIERCKAGRVPANRRPVETCLESRKVYPIHLQIGTLSSGDGREDLCSDHRSLTPSVSMKPNSHVKSRRGDDSFPMCLCNTSAVEIPSIWFTAADSEDSTVPSFPSFGRHFFYLPSATRYASLFCLLLYHQQTLPLLTLLKSTTFPTFSTFSSKPLFPHTDPQFTQRSRAKSIRASSQAASQSARHTHPKGR
jgi:hypothetical protein